MYKNKYRIWISKTTYIGCILYIIGIVFIVQGIINSYNKITNSYSQNDIHLGRYIECNITKEHLLGSVYSEMNGKKVYSAICDNDVYTNDQRYIMLTNTENIYYVSLNVPNKYIEEFQKLISDEISTLHVYGKFKKLKSELFYDDIMRCLNLKNDDEINRLVSSKYVIQIVEPEMERRVLFKGVLLLLVGVLCLRTCLEKNY